MLRDLQWSNKQEVRIIIFFFLELAESKDMNVEKTFLQLLLHIDIYVSFTHINDLYMGIMCVHKMCVYVYVYKHLTERLK